MRGLIAAALLCFVPFASWAQDSCNEALKFSVLKSSSSSKIDWRVLTHISEAEYDQVKHDGGANFVVGGLPLGASYADFHQRASSQESTHQESFSDEEARDVFWTGLSENSKEAYVSCIKNFAVSQSGLYLSIIAVTRKTYTLLLTWKPTGAGEPVQVHFIGNKDLKGSVDDRVTPVGSIPFSVERPDIETVLTVYYDGSTQDPPSITLVPVPRELPRKPCDLQDKNGQCLKCSGYVDGQQGFGSKSALSFSCPDMAYTPGSYFSSRVDGFVENASPGGSQVNLSLSGPGEQPSATLELRDVNQVAFPFALETQFQISKSPVLQTSINIERCFTSKGEDTCQISKLNWQICSSTVACVADK